VFSGFGKVADQVENFAQSAGNRTEQVLENIEVVKLSF